MRLHRPVEGGIVPEEEPQAKTGPRCAAANAADSRFGGRCGLPLVDPAFDYTRDSRGFSATGRCRSGSRVAPLEGVPREHKAGRLSKAGKGRDLAPREEGD